MISAYIDRLEGDLAVLLLGDEMKKVNFPVCFLPDEVGEGDYLKLDISYDKEANEVIAPTFRHDLFRMADLAEEVARFYGYDNIPTTLPKGEATEQAEQEALDLLKE